MLSMPPATITSASPSWMAWAASTTAFSPEPQALFTVKLGTSFGTPPSSAATRPGFNPSAAGSTWPRITSSTCAGSRRARRIASRTATPPSLVAGVCARAPPRVPMAVRVALTITGVGMTDPPSSRGNVAPPAASRHPLDSDSCATETGALMARFALIMSGGGARGAYEAGVLSYVLDDLPRRLARPAARRPRADRHLALARGARRLPGRRGRRGGHPAPPPGARRPADDARRGGHPRAFDRPPRHAPARAPGAREHPVGRPPPPRGRGRGRRGRRGRHGDQLRQVRGLGRQPRGRRAPLGARPVRHRPPGPARARARARLGGHSVPLPGAAHRRRLLLRRRAAPEHAARAGAPPGRRPAPHRRAPPHAHARGGGRARRAPRGELQLARLH